MYVIPYKRDHERYKSKNGPTIIKLHTIHLLTESFPTSYRPENWIRITQNRFFPFDCSSVLTLKKPVLTIESDKEEELVNNTLNLINTCLAAFAVVLDMRSVASTSGSSPFKYNSMTSHFKEVERRQIAMYASACQQNSTLQTDNVRLRAELANLWAKYVLGFLWYGKAFKGGMCHDFFTQLRLWSGPSGGDLKFIWLVIWSGASVEISSLSGSSWASSLAWPIARARCGSLSQAWKWHRIVVCVAFFLCTGGWMLLILVMPRLMMWQMMPEMGLCQLMMPVRFPDLAVSESFFKNTATQAQLLNSLATLNVSEAVPNTADQPLT
jgi:hypothetical protein